MFPTSSSSKLNNDETLPANDCPVPMSCLKCWDLTQSREGRDKIRNVLAPLVLTTSIFFLIIGATWARFLDPECGITLASARFSISTSGQNRIVSGNGCPGYDWRGKGTSQSPRETAGEYPFIWKLPLIPIIVAKPFYIGTSNSIDGPIGVTLNGIPIWGPSVANGQDAVALESNQYDACGGMSTPPNHFAFSAPITGYYHYRIQPGKSSPSSTGVCSAVQTWYNESTTGHSPLIGFMADGIPLYGPYTKNSQIPVDLDQCGGHASDLYPYYHYHIRQNGNYPYTIQCLHGCLDGTVNKALNNQPCQPNTTTTTTITGMKPTTVSKSMITKLRQSKVHHSLNSRNSSSSSSTITISPQIIPPSAHIPTVLSSSSAAAAATTLAQLQTTTPVQTSATTPSPSKSPIKTKTISMKPTIGTPPSFMPTVSTTRSALPTVNPSSINGKSPSSVPAPAATNNYTSLSRMKYAYGGNGINGTNWSGPASLLAFGFLFFIPSILCLGCMCCQYKQYCCQCCQCDNMGDQELGKILDYCIYQSLTTPLMFSNTPCNAL